MSREERFRRAFVILLVVAISATFIAIIRAFLLTILLAAIFSGLAYPVYQALREKFGGRAALASFATLLLLFILVVAPLATIGTIVFNQAVEVTQNIGPAISRLVQQPSDIDAYLDRVPGIDRLGPYKAQILTKIGELAGTAGTVFVKSLSGTIGGTIVVIAQFFIVLYTMFFFLKDGKRMLTTVLTYLPLHEDDKQRVVDRFVSVARATLKGTVFIGVVQGTLSGLAFWAVGIRGSVFWGTVMIVLSIVPGIGGALVWVPAVIVLLLTGAVLKGILLAAFCSLVVGTIDNLIRPRLVGRDTRLHELLIFFSTIGGLLVIGPMGFLLGPIVAALFVTVWEIFGAAFRNELDSAANTPVSPEIIVSASDRDSLPR